MDVNAFLCIGMALLFFFLVIYATVVGLISRKFNATYRASNFRVTKSEDSSKVTKYYAEGIWMSLGVKEWCSLYSKVYISGYTGEEWESISYPTERMAIEAISQYVREKWGMQNKIPLIIPCAGLGYRRDDRSKPKFLERADYYFHYIKQVDYIIWHFYLPDLNGVIHIVIVRMMMMLYRVIFRVLYG